MRVQRGKSKRSSSTLPKILLSLVLIVGVSFGLAWVWQRTESAAPPESEPDIPEVREEEPVISDVVARPDTSKPEASAPEEEPDESQPEDETPPAEILDGSTVPASAAVDNSYFDDAIFIGDSISTGIPLYHVADNAAVVAMTGINTDNINYKPCIDLGGEERVTILQAAGTYGPRSKVYIMLGGNGIGFDKETFIAGYKTFLDSVKQLYPDATIYLQSMTPVVKGYVNEFDATMNNEKIDDYNLEIKALAERERVHYLDVGSALKDETGYLPLEASPVDGLHFTPEYYTKWFDYLKTHTVEGAQ